MKNCITCRIEFAPTRLWQKYCRVSCRRKSPAQKANVRDNQRLKKDFVNQIKIKKGCAKCGYNAHPAALDFNHVRGEKKFNVSQDVKVAKDKLLAEIDKCEVLCANCHRVHTYENRHWQVNRKDRNDNPVA
jgi:hypothetical protein